MKKIVDINNPTDCKYHRVFVEEDAMASTANLCCFFYPNSYRICLLDEGNCPLPDAPGVTPESAGHGVTE